MLAARYGWVALSEQFQIFNNDVMIGAAIVMSVGEFFADKIPYFDTLWDAIHTAIRPIGGAVAASSHLTKTSTRAAANTSPEPFSNWILSLGEDVFAVGLGYVALTHPVIAFGITVVVLGDCGVCGRDRAHGATVVCPFEPSNLRTSEPSNHLA